MLASIRSTFRAAAVTIVPRATDLDEGGWVELERIVERALEQRPPRIRRQLVLFLRAISVLARVRYGRSFATLDAARRTVLLERLQDSPRPLLRRGCWGLRTLVQMGYYARPAAAEMIGYRGDPRGWEARR